MNTPLTELPKQTSDFSLTFNDYIKTTAEGLAYGFAALSLYAIPLGTAYFIFQLILD